MEKKQGLSRLHRVVSGALAVLMVATCVFMLAAGIVPNRENLLHAVQYRSKLNPYLPDGRRANALELLTARIRSLESELSLSVYKAETLGQLNASLQYAIGKRLVSTGSAQMVRLNGGYLYDLQEEQSAESAAREILDLRDSLPEGLPFLFVYEHNTVYDPAMLPAGYDALDYGAEFADEAVSLLRAGDVPVIDSRDVLGGGAYPLERLLMRTDQHWTTFAALVMSRALAVWARDEAGLPVDPALLDAENFETETYPGLFLGKYGQRIGAGNVDPDDIILYSPKYETQIARRSTRSSRTEEAAGTFSEAVVRWDRLETDGQGWNIKAYGDYGLSEIADEYRNDNAPDCRILIFKDSYSAPISAFLSLVASDIYAVDLRQVKEPALYYVEQFRPDIVIMAYSQQMLRNRDYAFAD